MKNSSNLQIESKGLLSEFWNEDLKDVFISSYQKFIESKKDSILEKTKEEKINSNTGHVKQQEKGVTIITLPKNTPENEKDSNIEMMCKIVETDNNKDGNCLKTIIEVRWVPKPKRKKRTKKTSKPIIETTNKKLDNDDSVTKRKRKQRETFDFLAETPRKKNKKTKK